MSSAEVSLEVVDRNMNTACRIHVPYDVLWKALRADSTQSGSVADHVVAARRAICELARQAMAAKGRSLALYLNWSDISDSVQESAGLKPSVPVVYHDPGQLVLFAS